VVAFFAVSVVLIWLSGFWVGPRTPDAYMRRLLGTSSTWVADTQWSYDVYSRESAKLAGRIARLVPPADFADDHGQLAGILADASRVVLDRSVPLAERTSQSLVAAAALEEVNRRMGRAASTPAQQRYAAKISSLLAERRERQAVATRKIEHASEIPVQRVTRMKPPAAVRAEHAALADAFSAYLGCVREYNVAARARDAERADAAAGQLQVAQVRVRKAGDAVLWRLDHKAGWPVPTDSNDTRAG
jgi:hypothetical protein